MIDTTIQTELLRQVEQLPLAQQRQVLDFVQTLVGASHGEPPKHFLDLFGTLPHEDAREMMEAIEEGCERIDASRW
jgi:hypothetical protein